MAMGFSLYGVSNVMTGICGDIGDLDEELCARWAQLGAFMPMVRNYYNATYNDWATGLPISNPASEFYNFNNETYIFMIGAALNQRLLYSRYIYSQLYKVYLEGGAVVRPLFFDYPTDDKCFEDLEHTYMLGDSIKVSPVLDAGVTLTYKSYFPKGKWVDLNNYTTIIDS